MESQQAVVTERPHYIDSLCRANEARGQRAAAKRHLREAENEADALARCAELIVDPPAHIEALQVATIVGWCRGIGERRAAVMLGWVAPPVSATIPLAQLPTKRRRQVAAVLRNGRLDDHLRVRRFPRSAAA